MTRRQRKIPIANPKDIFDEAETFMIAYRAIMNSSVKQSILSKDMGKSIGLTYAAYVNHAFAFELYLKCLMGIENGYFYEGHNLLDLFQKLSQETQDKIISYHDNLTISRHKKYHGFGFDSEGNFITLLSEASNAFVDFRYLFGDKSAKNYDLSIPSKYVKDVILEKCPLYLNG